MLYVEYITCIVQAASYLASFYNYNNIIDTHREKNK